jgi:hypothetical protein
VSDSVEDSVTVFDPSEAAALIAGGAILQRHAHQMRLDLPPADISMRSTSDFRPFAPGGVPPVPWKAVLPAFLKAYPPDHPDHVPGGESLIDDYLVPYTAGARLGKPLSHASAIAVRDDYAYAGILVVDRPGEGAWVCDIWRDPAPEYAGSGEALLLWSASQLTDYGALGLVVTVANDRARRAYERAGCVITSTAWRFRAP